MRYIWILFFIMVSAIEAGIPFFVRTATGSFERMRWPNSAITVHVNASTASSLSNAQVMSEIQIAANQWQNIADSSVSFTVLTTATSPDTLGGSSPNMMNHISFGSGSNFNPGVIAITFTTARNDNGQIVDADIMFNKQDFVFVDNVANSDPLANRILLSGVATHEFGHLLGFDHSPIRAFVLKNAQIPESTMFPFYSNDQLTLAPDDVSLLSFTYPGGSSPFNGFVSGQIQSGAIAGEVINGAHVLIWDVEDRSKIYSSISGITGAGINFDGRFEVLGVPRGNYEAFIEPFPIAAPNYPNRQVQLQNDFVFLNAVPETLRQSFLNRVRTFPVEFWHNQAESALEPTSGSDTAVAFFLPVNGRQTVNFVTNQGNSNVNLSSSSLEVDQKYLYPNGRNAGEDLNLSWTRGKLIARNNSNQVVDTDLSERLTMSLAPASLADYSQNNLSSRASLCLTVAQPSFSRTTFTTSIQPTYIQSTIPYYAFELYAPLRTGAPDTCLSRLSVSLDSQTGTTQTFISDLLFISKANSDRSLVTFIPDIVFGIKNSGRQVFGDANKAYSAPGTFKIEPRFPNDQRVLAPISVTPDTSFTTFTTSQNSPIVTSPIAEISDSVGKLYQTTVQFAGEDNAEIQINLDGVALALQPAINFQSISPTGSSFLLSQGTVHITFPGIATAVAEIRIFPAFADQTPIPFLFQPSDFNVILTGSAGLPLFGSGTTGPFVIMNDGLIDPFPSPRKSDSLLYLGNPFYRSFVPAQAGVGSYNVRVSIVDIPLTQQEVLKFDTSNAALTEIVAAKRYLAMNSGEEIEVELIPRFSDNTRVNADISGLAFLSLGSSNGCHDTLATLRNGNNQETSPTNLSINPSPISVANSIRLTTVLKSRVTGFVTTSCPVTIAGRINSGGFQDIGKPARVEILDISENRLEVILDSELLPADGNSTTRITVIPTFPDGSRMGPNLDATRIKANITNGEFLRKTFQPDGVTQFLSPEGNNQVSFFNNKDGTYELSIRSTNFSTRALITLYVDDRLSLITKEIIFSKTGSADPDKTLIFVDTPVIYANGKNTAKITIYPRTVANEPLFLPETSIVSVFSTLGVLQGAITSNADGSWTQVLRSIPSSLSVTAEVRVEIDSIRMQPNQTVNIRMVNLDASKVVADFIFPQTNRIDPFDIAIMARHIRQNLCTATRKDNCLLDFNSDGVVNELDMQLMLKAYGNEALQ
ncbi:MAG: matrixin family metalloprotease [Candidatus Cloacimonetes bacterium]|nr:matrixin family metalloprotease [Candidatus Cloacimonadota bacterium]